MNPFNLDSTILHKNCTRSFRVTRWNTRWCPDPPTKSLAHHLVILKLQMCFLVGLFLCSLSRMYFFSDFCLFPLDFCLEVPLPYFHFWHEAMAKSPPPPHRCINSVGKYDTSLMKLWKGSHRFWMHLCMANLRVAFPTRRQETLIITWLCLFAWACKPLLWWRLLWN